jgi:hypothetical protein
MAKLLLVKTVLTVIEKAAERMTTSYELQNTIGIMVIKIQ